MQMTRERMTIHGDLGSTSFLPWISRHAARLGIQGDIRQADALRVDIDLFGPPDLIDAMEMGCLLGPIDVWVDNIERHAR